MAKHDTQTVSYMRKDSHFLADGIWYISTPCVVCGLIDEEVPWSEAKTPHHAGLIADQRHLECSLARDEENQRAYKFAEIEAARGEVVRVEGLLEQATKVAETLELAIAALTEQHPVAASAGLEIPGMKAAQAKLAQAMKLAERHMRGVGAAQRRLADTERANQ